MTLLTGLTTPPVCTCHKLETIFPTPYKIVFNDFRWEIQLFALLILVEFLTISHHYLNILFIMLNSTYSIVYFASYFIYVVIVMYWFLVFSLCFVASKSSKSLGKWHNIQLVDVVYKKNLVDVNRNPDVTLDLIHTSFHFKHLHYKLIWSNEAITI